MKLFFLNSLLALGTAVTAADLCGDLIAATTRGVIFYSTVRNDCGAKITPTTSTFFVTPSPTDTTTTTFLPIVVTSTETIVSTEHTILSPTVLNTQTETSIVTTFETSTATHIETAWQTNTPAPALTTITDSVTNLVVVTVTTWGFTSTVVKREIDARTLTAKVVPNYATTACSDFAEYSNACGLIGHSGTHIFTSTLPVETNTVVESITSGTAVITETTTVGELLTLTSPQTSIVPATEFTTLTISTSATITETVTSITNAPQSTVSVTVVETHEVVSTTTVTVPMPTFKVEMTPIGTGNKLYLFGTPADQTPISGTSLQGASLFTIDSENRFINLKSRGYAVSAYGQDSYYFNFWRPTTYFLYKVDYELNIIPFTLHPDLSLTFSYKASNAFTILQNYFYYSTADYSGRVTYTARAIPV